MASTSSPCASQKASSTHDELLMQQRLLFSDTLKDMKNLRKQLYTAADFFEASYIKQKQKKIVVGTLKDYAIQALVNTVDHLGSVAFKINSLLDEKIGAVSETELRITCLEQRVKSYQEFINQAGLSQQSSVIVTPRYHKRYIIPDEEISHGFGQNAEEDSPHFSTAADTTTMKSPSFYIREMYSTLKPPEPSPRQGAFSLTRISSNAKKPGRSPLHFSHTCVGSLLKRSPLQSYSSTHRQYPSEPQSSVPLSTFTDKTRSKDFEQYSSKSKRLFKALLSFRKQKKDGTLYSFFYDN